MKQKSLEDRLLEVEKKIEKNWKKLTVIIATVVIVVSLALFLTGLRIKFALTDELIIHLEPQTKSFFIRNNQNQSISFNISTDNSVFCNANCSYTFYDRSEEKILEKGKILLRDKGSFERGYILEPFRTGSGQKIYSFDIECSNIRSFLCSTKSPARRRTSFITLNYKLTPEEEALKSELKGSIAKSFVLLNNASSNLQKAEYLLNLNGLHDNLNDDFLLISENLDRAIKTSEEIASLWSQEKYVTINALYWEFFNSSIFSESELILNKITDSIGRQNNLSKSFNSLRNELMIITSGKENYIINSGNLSADFYKILDLMNISKFDILNITAAIGEFSRNLEVEYQSVADKGRNITSFEYSKKCYLGYCENSTLDFCNDLSKIFSEYENDTYASNSSIGNISYYLQLNDSIKILVSNESYKFYESYCLGISLLPDIPDKEILIIPDEIETEMPIKNELTENKPMCCVYGQCQPCCAEECSNKQFPVIFLHGHSLLRETSLEPLLDSFNKIQHQLQDDNYINAGIVRFDFNISDYENNDWGLAGYPITARGSYYYDYYYSLGKYIYITRSKDNIDTYAIRLNDIVKLVKHRTGKDKVNIIAHSMGGLVARRYLQIFGEESVDKLILIATPNKGVSDKIKRFCRIFGEKKECEDLYDDSILLKKLNDPNYKLKKARVYTISGKGCDTNGEDGDGIVAIESSLMENTKSYFIDGTCTDTFGKALHSDMLDIDKYPQSYQYVKEILEER